MNEENHDSDGSIDSRTNIKLPISFIVSGLVGLAIFSFSQWQAHLAYDNERFKAEREHSTYLFEKIRTEIDKKTASRYTAVEARQYQESIKQRLLDIERSNDKTHKSLQRQLDELHEQLDRIYP